MYHGPNIILATGITVHGFRDKEQMGITLNLPMAFVNFIGTLIAVGYIDNKGRRFLILKTLPGIIVTLILISGCMYLTNY